MQNKIEKAVFYLSFGRYILPFYTIYIYKGKNLIFKLTFPISVNIKSCHYDVNLQKAVVWFT